MARRAAYGSSLALFILSLFLAQPAFCAPSNTMSISPSAVAGQTISAADENSRNTAISTTYNSHSHADISTLSGTNSLTIGDGTSGTKSYLADDSQAASPGFRFRTTYGFWELSQDGSTWSPIQIVSGVVITGENNFRVGDNLGTANKRITANEDTTDGYLEWNASSNYWGLANDAATTSAIYTVSGVGLSTVNEIQIGNGTSSGNKMIYANTTAAVQDPSIRYNIPTSTWQASNNGTTWANIVTTSSGIVDAWVKFNGSGTISSSSGVTSVTRNGAGDYTVTFSTAFGNANYAYSYLASDGASGLINAGSQTTTQVRVLARDNTVGSATDPTENVVIAIGD